MAENCRQIVDRLKQSRVKIEIVKLLRENPFLMDTARGLARWSVLPPELVANEAEELRTMGLLVRYGQGEVAIYRYTRDAEIRSCIDQHWEEIDQALMGLKIKEWRGEV